MTAPKPRVLIASYAFWPSLGGLEIIAEQLARGLNARGHVVEVLTATPAPEAQVERSDLPYPVLRSPGLWASLMAFRRADIVISKHLALRTCWPILLIRRPLIIWHATWYPEERRLNRYLRKAIMHRARNIGNSAAIGASLDHCDGMVHPGYDDSRFRNEVPWSERDMDFAYIGRLGAEKGVDLLIEAVAELPGTTLSIIGSGSLEPQLRERVEALEISDRVHFLGRMEAKEINAALNRHKVMVAPSRYDEPFGTVALEGQAAGCRVVVSSGGGFPEAAGPGGIVFTNGDIDALRDAMQQALEPMDSRLSGDIDRHLESHRIQSFVAAFSDMITAAMRR
ncbi:glycosyltransferase family 4 protein [Acidimangrovimonas sediminis]|uniref:glycosyltransferase family 4 protein n=1 Tax=Acidimangrovimonas sediminis TaxID=2056283 RepID=UPI001304D9B8|nr:glycosyltransferase family 4 protein [Acidimangrovimonas sediminis]